jgi:sec-independent protein translocase protein TatA
MNLIHTKENEMIGKLGLPELLLLLGVALLIFGPGKIGELGKGIGDGIRGFKTAIQDDDKQPSK